MTEEWRPVVGYEGLYEVSSLGRVKSLQRKTPRILRPWQPPTYRNYPGVWLCRDGHHWRRPVHFIVAAAFLPPKPSPKHELRHLDCDHLNSAVYNLAWGTRKENKADTKRCGRSNTGERHGQHKLTDEQVRKIRFLFGKVSYEFLGAWYDVNPETIRAIATGRTWSHVQ